MCLQIETKYVVSKKKKYVAKMDVHLDATRLVLGDLYPQSSRPKIIQYS
jgi:hypothetical protein